MPSLLIGVVVTLSVVATIVVLLRIFRAQADDIRMLPKTVWYLIAIVPVAGALAWAMLGRPLYVAPGKRVAKDRQPRGRRQKKMNADRQLIVDRLTSDVRTREARTSAMTAGSPGTPENLIARADASAASARTEPASPPATALYRAD
jgi:hypothetical protein